MVEETLEVHEFPVRRLQLEPIGEFRAARNAGPRIAGRVGEGVSVFVGGTRNAESVLRTAPAHP